MQENTIHIAYADSNDIVRSTVAQMLRFHGYRVTCFATGTELLEYLDTLEHPSIVMMDVCLADIDGFTVARLIRERIPLIKLVVFSGHGKVLRKSYLEGVDLVLAKPMYVKEMDVRLRELAREEGGNSSA
jgi:CheY-like chemotaxis protein